MWPKCGYNYATERSLIRVNALKTRLGWHRILLCNLMDVGVSGTRRDGQSSYQNSSYSQESKQKKMNIQYATAIQITIPGI